jgi:hypothetical protein
MADVSIYVAVIAAGGPVMAGAVPLIVSAAQGRQQAERERWERHGQTRRLAYVHLLEKAGEVRAFVADYHDYSGEEKHTRLAEVRRNAQAAKVTAADVRFMVGPDLGESAARLAAAVVGVAEAAERSTHEELGASIQGPDFGELDKCIQDFTERAVEEALGERARPPKRRRRRGHR